MKRLLSIVLLLSMTLCGCAQTKFIINPFWSAGAPVDNAVFDGSNDWITNTTALAAVTDSKTATVSFWIRFDGGDGVTQNVFVIDSGGVNRYIVDRLSSNVMRVRGFSSAAVQILAATSSVTVNIASGWTHFYFTCDLADTAKRKMYIDGVEDTSVTYGAYSDQPMDLAAATPGCTIGASLGGGTKMTAAIAEFWFNDAYLNDPTKFVLSSCPVNLGLDGSLPTGSAPAIYLSSNGGGNDWAVDSSGNGNTLNVNGSLTGTTSPCQ